MGNQCGQDHRESEGNGEDIANGTPMENQEAFIKYSSNKKIKVHINSKYNSNLFQSPNEIEDENVNVLPQEQHLSKPKTTLDFSRHSKSMVKDNTQSNFNADQSTLMQTPQKQSKMSKMSSNIKDLSSIKKSKGSFKNDETFNARSSFQLSAKKGKYSQSVIKQSSNRRNRQGSDSMNKLNKAMDSIMKRPEKRIIIDKLDPQIANLLKNVAQQNISTSKKQQPSPFDNEILKYIFLLDQSYSQLQYEETLYEGELMKYIPGFQNSYFNRYCQASKNEFKYYKNEMMSVKHAFPLVSISIDDIQKVQRVNLEIPTLQPIESIYNQYQFEIFLKEKDVQSSLKMPYSFIEEQKLNLSNVIENNSNNNNNKNSSRQNRFKSNLRNQAQFRNNSKINEPSFERKLFKSHSLQNCSATRFQTPNHLMPKMIPCRQKRINSQSAERAKIKLESELNGEQKRIIRPIDISSIFPKNISTSQLDQNFAYFIQELEQNLSIPLEPEKYEVKNPSKWIKNLGGPSTWTNREVEWQLAEDRLLFSCLSDNECDRWVCLLTFLISKRNQY